MPTIDSDAHVLESPRTWSFMREDEQIFRPQIFVRSPNDGAPTRPNQRNEYWVIEGRLQTKSNVGDDVPEEARDLTDVRRRLAHMDEVGIDVQVLYPSLFLRPITKEPDVEFALVRSYNRWLASIWKQSDNRLRWVAMPPLLSLIDPGKVRAELEFCKENGACGIFMRGMECDRLLTHRYFFPLYKMAEEMGLPITLHAGINSFPIYDAIPIDAGPLMLFKFPVMGAFSCLLEEEMPKRFPGVNWAFIEASAQWVPYILGEVKLRLNRKGKRLPSNPLEGSNFYITTQKTDDLPWLLSEIGDDNLLIGTDYGHKDTATEVEALKRLSEDGNIPRTTTDKILRTNPGILYGLS